MQIVKKCTCPGGTRWLQEPPTSHNAYRVDCISCHKFIKWGPQAQLDELIAGNHEVEVISYGQQLAPKPDPFAPFYVNDD